VKGPDATEEDKEEENQVFQIVKDLLANG